MTRTPWPLCHAGSINLNGWRVSRGASQLDDLVILVELPFICFCFQKKWAVCALAYAHIIPLISI